MIFAQRNKLTHEMTATATTNTEHCVTFALLSPDHLAEAVQGRRSSCGLEFRALSPAWWRSRGRCCGFPILPEPCHNSFTQRSSGNQKCRPPEAAWPSKVLVTYFNPIDPMSQSLHHLPRHNTAVEQMFKHGSHGEHSRLKSDQTQILGP